MPRHIPLILVAALCLSATVQSLAAEKYALLVGVTKYEHSGMSALKYPEDDAKALGELLKSGGYTVELLLGKDATQKAIGDQLGALRKQGSADGVIVLGLFGHGVEVETEDADGTITQVSCYCPFDTSMREVKDSQGRPIVIKARQPQTEPDPSSLVDLSEVLVSFQLAKAGHRVVLADLGRTVPNQARSFSSGLSVQHLPKNTALLSSCSQHEQAYEHPDWNGGAFSTALMKEIPALAKDGPVAMGSLADRVRWNISKKVHDLSKGRDIQTPVLMCTESVDLQWQATTP